jgi:hypothetical protein
MYTIKNPYRDDADELQSFLAEKMYDLIRESETDIDDIASNMKLNRDIIRKIKEHVFFNIHTLDRYDDDIEHRRFDANIKQALVWKRMQAGIYIYNEGDIIWLNHEFTERHYELKYDLGCSKSHEKAQKYYDGEPWKKWNNYCEPFQSPANPLNNYTEPSQNQF